MSGITIKIAADVEGFKRGQRDAVSSARRGAQEIAVAYASTSPVLTAMATSARINFAAMQLGSGNVASMMSGAMTTAAKDGFGAISTGAQQGIAHIGGLEQKLAALPAPVAAVVNGLAAFEAVTTVWRAFNQALEDTEVRLARLNAIRQAAAELGTGTTFLTQLAAQAKDLGVTVETLTGMLATAREASRVRIGEGKDAVNESAVQARLRQNVMAGNLTAADVAPYNAATTQEGQIRAILDLLEKLRAANREVAGNDLGRTFFGADFEAKTRQGIDLITAMRNALDGAKAQGSGLAPTEEEIARASELQQREEAIAATIRDAIAPAVHDFNYLSDLGKATWIEWEEHVAGWVKWLGEGYLKLRDVAKTVRDMAADWGLIGRPEAPTGQNDGDPLVVRVRNRRKPADQSNPLPSLRAGARTPREAQDPDSVANLIRQLEKARDVAEAELKTVGLSNVEKERAVDIAKAEAAARADVEKGTRDNAALTADEVARITAAANATATFKDRQKDLEQQLRNNAEAARYFGDALANSIGDAVLQGKSLNDIMHSLAQTLGRGALQALFTGTGPLASILGTAPAASAGPNAVGGLAGLFSSGSGGGGLLSSLLGFAKFSPIPAFASGTILSGPGSGTSDSMVARVSNGEAIIPARAVAAHRPVVEALIKGKLPGFADGRLPDPGAFSAALGAAGDRAVAALPPPTAAVSGEARRAVGEGMERTVVQGDTNHYSFPQPGATPEMIVKFIDRNNKERDRSIQARLQNAQRRFPG